jgi:hypothetical protein
MEIKFEHVPSAGRIRDDLVDSDLIVHEVRAFCILRVTSLNSLLTRGLPASQKHLFSRQPGRVIKRSI